MLSVARLAVKFILHRRLRSFLTTLGIAIGVALVFSLVSINRGFVQSVTELVSSLGDNFAIVLPKTASFVGRSAYFTQREIDAVERLPYVRIAVGGFGTILPVEVRGEELFLTVRSGEPDKMSALFSEIQAYDFDKGRAIKDGERGVVVVGNTLADRYRLSPGSRLRIAGRDFRVVGVMKKVGNPQQDNIITANIEDLWDITGERGKYLLIFVKMTELNEDGLKRAIKRVRGRDDFDVETPQKLANRLTSIIRMISAFFIAVASISILVGSVGIANTMYASVMERTRDIGIMKAVGASRSAVAAIFMMESGLLATVGGIAGTLVGLGITWGFSYYVSATGILASFGYPLEWGVLLATLLGSFAVGVVAGLFPALYAAGLEPVQALRRKM